MLIIGHQEVAGCCAYCYSHLSAVPSTHYYNTSSNEIWTVNSPRRESSLVPGLGLGLCSLARKFLGAKVPLAQKFRKPILPITSTVVPAFYRLLPPHSSILPNASFETDWHLKQTGETVPSDMSSNREGSVTKFGTCP